MRYSDSGTYPTSRHRAACFPMNITGFIIADGGLQKPLSHRKLLAGVTNL